MKRNTLSNLLLALGLVLALGSGIVMARRTLAQGLGSQGPLGVSDTLGTAFTYQGRLTDTDGVPLSGDYDFQFQLYDALSGDAPVGSAVAVGDKEVTDGYFTAQLDFGNVFDGTALWLEVRVRPGAETGAYTALSPRQSLTAAPYARYAAVAPWSGLNGVPAGFADNTDNTDDTVTWSEISGIVGTGANQVAAGAHSHDDRYYTETELQTDDSASVHWGNLTNVPTGFADDTDNTDDTVTWGEISGIVGTGANQVAAGAHDHWGEAWSGTGAGLTLSGGDTGLHASGSAYGVSAGGNTADLRLDGVSGVIYAKEEQQSDLKLYSNSDVDIHLDDADYTPNAHFRILNDADTAVFTVDESGAIASAADTEIAASPLNMVAYYASNIELRPMSGFMEMRPPDVCNPTALVPVDLPSVLLGTATKLKSVRICYKCDTSASYITLTRVRYVTDSGGYTQLISDGTDRTSTTWDCYTLTDATPNEIQGSLYVEIGSSFAAAGSNHDIRIGRITLTLTE